MFNQFKYCHIHLTNCNAYVFWGFICFKLGSQYDRTGRQEIKCGALYKTELRAREEDPACLKTELTGLGPETTYSHETAEWIMDGSSRRESEKTHDFSF
jgi:hypothetical protein